MTKPRQLRISSFNPGYLRVDNFPLNLSPEEPPDSEAVKYVKKVHFSKLLEYVPWMSEKDEYIFMSKLLNL